MFEATTNLAHHKIDGEQRILNSLKEHYHPLKQN